MEISKIKLAMEEEDNEVKYEERTQRRIRTRNDLRDVCSFVQENRQEIRKLKSGQFARHLNKLDNAVRDAEHTRELQLDAIALKELSLAAKEQAVSVFDQSKNYDFSALSNQLRKQFGQESSFTLDWHSLGETIGDLFLSPIECQTMFGALEKEIKIRKIPQRKSKETEEDLILNKLVKPSEVKQNEDDKDDSKALQRSQFQYSQLRSMTQTNNNNINYSTSSSTGKIQPLNLLEFLIDPEDVVQSIENIFDYSFLLKVSLL
jgi:hypothetical protein